MEDNFRFDDHQDDVTNNDGGGKPGIMGFDIEWKSEEDGDVLMRLKNEGTGQEITFVTAPENLFDGDVIGPMVTAFQDQVIVAFNERKLDEMMDESIRANAEMYGEAAAAMLPISMLIRLGMKAAEPYFGPQFKNKSQ